MKNHETKTEVKDTGCAVYDPDQDRYASCLDEMIDNYFNDEVELPEWVHPCKEEPFGRCLDADSIVESRCSELFEDAYDHLVDLKGLQKFLNEWCDKQTLRVWVPDYTKKVRVNQETGGV